LAGLAQRVFLNPKLGRAEVHQQAVLDSGRTQVTQQLSHMFVRQSFGRFEFDEQPVVHE
jgi:hypothetical protein